MLCQTSGITFRLKENTELATMRPKGDVTLVLEPENKHDPLAIKVLWNDVHIGYIPKGEVQTFVHNEWKNNRTVNAKIESYSYYDESVKWNNQHIGQLQAITLEIDGHCGYNKDGVEYQSITTLLKYLNPGGNMDGLLRWCINGFTTFDEYEQELNRLAEKGTKLHNDIEKELRGEDSGFEPIKEFIRQYKPEIEELEGTVFDSEILVAGRFDAFFNIGGKRVLLDWKSSKKVQKKHLLQASFYAKQVGADEVWIVCFGGLQKQGFGVTKILRPELERLYNVVGFLSEIYYELNPQKKQKQELLKGKLIGESIAESCSDYFDTLN